MAAPAFELHHIAYSEATYSACPTGFVALDYRDNSRPDWREFWPIRRQLLATSLDDQALYGFLSPKFGYKTGLDHAKIAAFLAQRYENQDVVIFSPFWDLSGVFQNVFEQGDFFHGGLAEVTQAFVERTVGAIPVRQTVTHSQNTIFCNYFLAKPAFWREWLALGERLLAIAEDPDDALGARLRAITTYGEESVEMKVFVMERLATLLLVLRPQFRTLAYDPFRFGASATVFSRYREEAIRGDALKLAFTSTGYGVYIESFATLRNELIRRLSGAS